MILDIKDVKKIIAGNLVNSAGLRHFNKLIIYCYGAEYLQVMNCLHTDGVRCEYLYLILHRSVSQLGGSGSNFIRLTSVKNCTKCCLQLVWAKFGKFSVIAVQRVIYETELRFL